MESELEKLLQLSKELDNLNTRLKFFHRELRYLINARTNDKINNAISESVNIEALPNIIKKSLDETGVISLAEQRRHSTPLHTIHVKSSEKTEDDNCIS